MRRPLLLLFIISLIASLIYTNINVYNKSYNDKDVTIYGIVKEKREKEKYDEYKIGNFLVRDYAKKNNLIIGKRLTVSGKLKSLDNMIYEDFDYGRYIKSMGYEGLLYINSYKVLGENKIYIYLGKIKKYISNTNKYLYKDKSNFINSILLGEKEFLSEEEKEMFNRTGTSHVIAISGLHTGIICSIIILLIGKINKIYKLLVLTILMVLYLIMIGFSPSIIRSIAFILILYLSFFIDKRRDSISSLSLVGILLIINNPYIIYNISFQLSFLSTLSIIYFYGYIKYKLKLSLILLTVCANILILPIMYYNFNGIAINSIISNLIIVPLMSVIIYLSIISVILFNVSIDISKTIAYLAKIIINTIYFVLEKLSDFSFSYIEIENPNFYFVIIYYILIFLYMFYKELKVIKEQSNELQGYNK